LGHRSSDKSLKKYLESIPRKHPADSLHKYSYKCNITHNTQSIVALNLRLERWGLPLAKEKYQGEQACDKRQHQQQQQYNNNYNYNYCFCLLVCMGVKLGL
jgi:hypothetical protein